MNITDLFIIIWLLVMGIIDIKKKAVPLALLIIFLVMSILLKLYLLSGIDSRLKPDILFLY